MPRLQLPLGVTALICATVTNAATVATLPVPATAATMPPVTAPAATAVVAPVATTAIVLRDRTAVRAAPRDSALQQALLWQGEAVEVRGERLDYLQIYDYRRERGGFVRASQVRRLNLSAAETPEMLAILRFIRDTPGSEAMAIGVAAAFIQAAPASTLQSEAGAEVLDIMGTAAERLARRASGGATGGTPASTPQSAAETTLAAHLDVAARYGVNFVSVERNGQMQICYDGSAFRRIINMPASAEQLARAAMSLTSLDCTDPEMRPQERSTLDEWRAGVLNQVDTGKLPGYLKNRVLMRRAEVWSTLAYLRVRRGETAEAAVAARRAIAELAGVSKPDLPDEDQRLYNDTAMRVSASRWAAQPAQQATPEAVRGLTLVTETRQPGETCVKLVDARHDAKNPLAMRCTYALVWPASATVNREGTALALAVQPLESWRELWVFRNEGSHWSVNVLPPSTANPELGYAEFAGWVPGGKTMLVTREFRGEGRYRRSFEQLRLDTLAGGPQASDPSQIAAFQRWQDPAWKRDTLSMR